MPPLGTKSLAAACVASVASHMPYLGTRSPPLSIKLESCWTRVALYFTTRSMSFKRIRWTRVGLILDLPWTGFDLLSVSCLCVEAAVLAADGGSHRRSASPRSAETAGFRIGSGLSANAAHPEPPWGSPIASNPRPNKHHHISSCPPPLANLIQLQSGSQRLDP